MFCLPLTFCLKVLAVCNWWDALVRHIQVWKGNCSVSMLQIGVYMVQCVVAPSGELHVLHGSGKNSLKACLTKIPIDDVYPISVGLLLPVNITQIGNCRANASIWWNVNSSADYHRQFCWWIEESGRLSVLLCQGNSGWLRFYCTHTSHSEHNPLPLLLPEFSFLSEQWMLWSVNFPKLSLISWCSQASVIISTQQSRIDGFMPRCSSSSLILWTMHLAFVRKMLGSGGLSGVSSAWPRKQAHSALPPAIAGSTNQGDAECLVIHAYQ